MTMQRRQYDQWIPTSHPPSNWNTPYYEHQIPPQYRGQHNFGSPENQIGIVKVSRDKCWEMKRIHLLLMIG